MNKKIIIVFACVIVVVAIILCVVFVTTKHIGLIYKGIEINLTYSSLNFNYEQKNEKEGTLKSNNEEVQLKINDNLKDFYESYNVLKDYRMMAYKGQEVEYNQIPCFYYYDSLENFYTVIAKINEESYLSINVKPKENNNKNAEEIFNQKKIQKILNTLEIKQ